MRESGMYPDGAEFDPRAPWNQSERCTKCEQDVSETFELGCDDTFLCEDCIGDVLSDGDPDEVFQVWCNQRSIYEDHVDPHTNRHRLVLNIAREEGWLE